MAYLLDTNTVINYLNATIPSSGIMFLDTIVDDDPIISVITKMETLGYNFKSAQEQQTMETFINNSKVIDLNTEIVNKTIEIRKIT
jgi:predicted nucleic acid-binding protein